MEEHMTAPCEEASISFNVSEDSDSEARFKPSHHLQVTADESSHLLTHPLCLSPWWKCPICDVLFTRGHSSSRGLEQRWVTSASRVSRESGAWERCIIDMWWSGYVCRHICTHTSSWETLLTRWLLDTFNSPKKGHYNVFLWCKC